MADAIAVTAAVAITAAVTALLLIPLRPTLAELCGGLDRGDVWTALAGGCLAVGAFFNGTMAYSMARSGFFLDPAETPQLALVHGVMFGLFVGISAISAGVLMWTRRIRRGVAPAPRNRPPRPSQN